MLSISKILLPKCEFIIFTKEKAAKLQKTSKLVAALYKLLQCPKG